MFPEFSVGTTAGSLELCCGGVAAHAPCACANRSYFQAFWTGIWRTTGSGVTLMLAPNDWAVASKRRNSEMRRSALVWDKANEDWR